MPLQGIGRNELSRDLHRHQDGPNWRNGVEYRETRQGCDAVVASQVHFHSGGRAAIRFIAFAIPEDTVDQPIETPHQLGSCLVRLLWMAVGNLVLILAAIAIVQNHEGFALTAADGVLIVTALCLPAVRYVDIRFLCGKTSDSRPATMTDWSRYSAAVLGASLVLWLGAHLISSCL
jgi:hypothetical protein